MNGRSENEADGRRMRTCESCQVGLGIMDLREFVDRFIYRDERCPTCRREVLPDPLPPKDGAWITVHEVGQLFGLSATEVRDAKSRGLLEWKSVGHTIRVLGYQVEELLVEGMLGGGVRAVQTMEREQDAICPHT